MSEASRILLSLVSGALLGAMFFAGLRWTVSILITARYAALLAPAGADSFEIAAAPSYIVNGNLSARITLDGREHFIWKKEKLEVTAARRNELAAFSSELADALLPVT